MEGTRLILLHAAFKHWGIEVPASLVPSLRILGCVPHSFSEDPSRVGSELPIVVTCILMHFFFVLIFKNFILYWSIAD